MSVSLNNSGYNPYHDLTRGISRMSQAGVYRAQILGNVFSFNARSLEVEPSILFTRCETKPRATRAACEKLQAKVFHNLASRITQGAETPGLQNATLKSILTHHPKPLLTPDNLLFGKSNQA